MRVQVRLFAILRDRAGADAVQLELPEGATIQTASAALIQQYPQLCDLLKRVAFAINREYVPVQTALSDGDELAIIPPVSGG